MGAFITAFTVAAGAASEIAKALTAHENGAYLRDVSQNARELYEARTELYNLEDGAADARRIDLARIRLQFCEDHEKRLKTAAPSSPAAHPAADVQTGTGAANPKP